MIGFDFWEWSWYVHGPLALLGIGLIVMLLVIRKKQQG
jgi:hypothetical protein